MRAESYESEQTRWRSVFLFQQGTNGHRNQPQGIFIKAFARELKRMRQSVAAGKSSFPDSGRYTLKIDHEGVCWGEGDLLDGGKPNV